MKMWNVVYEKVEDVKVENGEIVALIRQFVRDEDRQSEVREFYGWAPVLTVEG